MKNPTQLLLRLTHQVTSRRSMSCVCIPDRFAAENELTRVKREQGERFIKAAIRKDRPKPGSTYTLTYHYLDVQTVSLF